MTVSQSPSPISSAPVPEQAGGVLTIDLAALAGNWRRLSSLAKGAACAAVVKADAYGIGLEPAVRALSRAGCETFFVAHLSEAIRARAVAPAATIYVLNGLLPGTAASYAEFKLRPVLGSREEIGEWAGFCRAERPNLPAAIHVDTGMNRLGLPISEALTLARDPVLRDFETALLMSHLVSAEELANPINRRQIDAFAGIRQAFPHVPASLANSSGIFLPENPHYDLVRPGYALYGGNPTPGRLNPMAPVVRLEGRVIQVRTVQDGETAGYNATWTARGTRKLATVSVGYADGYPRSASNTDQTIEAQAPGGEAIVAGYRCPFAGRVSMDLTILDVTDVPDGAVSRGDLVTLIGDDLTIDNVARGAGTIGYEMLTSLGRRYARRYLGQSD